jgi:cyclic pyranopterin phosphate synthase
MSPVEIAEIAKIGTFFGVSKITLTGGEPLLTGRRLLDVISQLDSLKEISEISLVTNGVLLSRYVDDLCSSGLNEVSIDVPSLDRAKYAYVTGVDCFGEVLDSIRAIVGKDLATNLNVVITKGINDSPDEIGAFISFCTKNQLNLRFIEMLAFQDNIGFYRRHFVPISAVERQVQAIGKLRRVRRWGIRDYELNGITIKCMKCSCTGEFCSLCATSVDLFVTPDGRLKPCMMRSDNLLDISCLGEGEDRTTIMKKVFAAAIKRMGQKS